MKRKSTLIILLIATLLMVSACANTTDDNDSTNIPAEGGLTSFISTDINGDVIDQAVFEGHTLNMVNIWGTFCAPCIDELPDLAKLNEDYADEDFQVVGIVADAEEGNAKALESTLSIIEQTGANFIHILTSESLKDAKLKDVQYIPETIFVDSLGNQVGESYVGSKSYDDWSKIIEQLLSKDN